MKRKDPDPLSSVKDLDPYQNIMDPETGLTFTIWDIFLLDCYNYIVSPWHPDLLQLNPLIYELAITIMYMMTQVSKV